MRTALTQNWLVCRICLQSKEKMECIFSDNAAEDLTKMILECGGVPIKQYDHYPDKICPQCDNSLKIAYKFRMTCQRSHQHLSKFIAPVVIEDAEFEFLKNDDLLGDSDLCAAFPDDVDETLLTEDAISEELIEAKATPKLELGHQLENESVEDDELEEQNEHHNENDLENDTIPNDLIYPDDSVDADDLGLKLEPSEAEALAIKKELGELEDAEEAEIVDFYEPIEDVVILEGFEEQEDDEDHADDGEEEDDDATTEERTTSALSEEIEYLDEILNEELADSDEEFRPTTKTEITPNTPDQQEPKQNTPKSRGRPKGSKNLKKSAQGSRSSNTLASKGNQPDRRGRKPKNPDFTVYICDICGNTYPTQGRLTDHIKKHNPVKHHECEICGHAFVQAQQLSRHMNTHTGNRPFKCNYCPAAFADLSTRNKHHRIHTNERPYVCDVCGKAFAYTNTLKFHKMIHTGEKPFVCNLCGKGFHQAYKLRNHKRTHEKRAMKVKKLELEALASFQEVSDATSQLLEL